MFNLRATLDSQDRYHRLLLAALIYVSSYFDFNNSPPDSFIVDGEGKDFPDQWIEDYAKTCEDSILLSWGNDCHKKFEYFKEAPLIVWQDNFVSTAEQMMECLRFYPWTIATFGSVYDTWFGQKDYANFIFDYSDANLGWGCAFKGDGHKRIVSRRYLDYGPWRVIRDEANDITLIQFHDLNTDALTALEQANPGHKLMGYPSEGGFIQRDYQILNDYFSGLYSSSEKMLRFIINDRPITRTELLHACAARLGELLGEDRPIERVGYVFVIEEEARQNLHELWLRDIECWTYIEGIETRIDQDYTPPPPEKPEWVKRLELSSAA